MAQIRGQRAADNDNDPVEVRHYQILGSSLDQKLGGIPTSPIWSRWLVGTGYIFWQYFPDGIIISTPDTCASVLYGPIYHYWDQTGQFDGPLGAPSTDVLQLTGSPPVGASYAVFEHGVLYLDPDPNASVVELSPVSQGMVAGATGITPNGDGIAQGAQATIQGFADNALATDQRLSDNVKNIYARTSFNSTGPGGCMGGSFNAVGRSLLRSHILNVHFDFELTGCAGTFGNATADLRVEVRLFIDPPTVTARLVNYWIDSVGSPFSAGDQEIRSGLSHSLNGQYGHDLLNRTIPKGITVIAGIVEPWGDVNLYIAPLCAATGVLSSSAGAAGTLDRMRTLRDRHLITQHRGRDFVEVVDVFGPALLAALRDEHDGPALSDAIARLLARTFTEDADLAAIAARLETANNDLQALLSQPALRRDPCWPERLIRTALLHAREQLRQDVSFDDLLEHARRVIMEETERCRPDERDCSSAD